MTLEEILPHLKNGEKIYKRSWDDPNFYMILSKAKYLYLIKRNEEIYDTCYDLSGLDITANDWEIFKS